MKKEKIKKLRLKKDIKVIIIYMIILPIIYLLLDINNIYNLIAFMSIYGVNLLYIIAIINDKK